MAEIRSKGVNTVVEVRAENAQQAKTYARQHPHLCGDRVSATQEGDERGARCGLLRLRSIGRPALAQLAARRRYAVEGLRHLPEDQSRLLTQSANLIFNGTLEKSPVL